jgi:hypothetical protein
VIFVILLTLAALTASGQPGLAGADESKLALDKLTVLGSVMMIAAHPDDENTAVLAYYARGRKAETAYLSATRGEGAQNLVGSEQGDLPGPDSNPGTSLTPLNYIPPPVA